MEKAYDPQAIEIQRYQEWEKAGYFSAQGSGDPYCIMLPPPNVTGDLHMGHAFQHTLMDILIRYHHMRCDKTLWQGGTDHAGIATQMVVERQLQQQGIDRHQLGREAFIKKIWDWKKKSGDTITRQLRRLGTSIDWSRERFTLDEGLSEAVTAAFVQLYQEDLIYRGERLVNWDPILHTAISDLEVLSTAETGHMWYVKYPCSDQDQGHITIATTRPETMFGDAAIAVHPDDQRYRRLIGSKAILPLSRLNNFQPGHQQIPIIADEHVDPEFGTGCVKITPAHDFNDYEIWRRHKDSHIRGNPIFSGMPRQGLINIMAADATILNLCKISNEASEISLAVVEQRIPAKYRGKDRYDARKMIVADLEDHNYLQKTEPHTLMVPRSDRSGAAVEPYLTKQWYVNIQSLAEPAIKAVETGAVRFVPDHWSKTYFEWMRNIQDWCISRQIWWGHRIPVWYDINGNTYVAHSEEEARQKLYEAAPPSIVAHYGGNLKNASLVQDEDVLDTWFSSALWPFATLGWPEQTQTLEEFYPTNVLVTGFDIIFFWVARMLMMGLKFTGDVPFKEIYIHGLVRDAQGQKMSKSKGNVIDPIDLIDGIDLEALVAKRTTSLIRPKDALKIEKLTRKQFPQGIASYGTDALRMTFASLATQGRDINFDVGRIGGYRNFCNKLWNASRYVMLNIQGQDIVTDLDKLTFNLPERWIMTRLSKTIEQVTKGINNYRFDLASKAIYEFTWDEYCDWYLEFSKTVLADEHSSAEEKNGTRWTLLHVLEALVRLVHPFMPFISEEIWQKIPQSLKQQGATIMKEPYPVAEQIKTDPSSIAETQWLMIFILGIRRIRATRDIAPNKTLSVSVQGGSEKEQHWLQNNTHYIQSIANIDNISKTDIVAEDAVLELAGEMNLMVALRDIIDPQAELNKLTKELERLHEDNNKISKKLENKEFLERAPSEIVETTRQRQVMNNISIEKLEAQYQHTNKLIK